ncbi:hypothetical protein HPB47_007446 [Ixodes persulcatus]|uniref:Uncharacterized protein n=1 Tax=Ixodes persulcatus TaxID=34615 RepID=A0AC60P7U9_IXOPE|nr:hypothetical protein HPB47_007446 [Ixodes persulcatus]
MCLSASRTRQLATYVCREHRHEVAEIRYLKWGSLYFDVRDDKDRWVRTDVRAGDHIVLPPRCYHRFMPKTPDEDAMMIMVVPDGHVYHADYRNA